MGLLKDVGQSVINKALGGIGSAQFTGSSLNLNFNNLLRKKMSTLSREGGGQLKELYNGEDAEFVGGAPLQYPKDLGDEHFMLFKAVQR